MINDVKDIDDVISDIVGEEKEKDFFEHHKDLPKEEQEAYELGVLASKSGEGNPFEEKEQKKLHEAFCLGWQWGRE